MLSPLEITTNHYYWKPFQAYFMAFELKAYRDAVSFPKGRILDLGCEEGTCAQMLKELMGFETRLVGADINGKQLQQATKLSWIYSHVLRLDGACLPFKDESFDAVMANKVLPVIPDASRAVSEIGRILKKDGRFICTVPTVGFEQHYLPVEILRRIGLARLAQLYWQRQNRRFTHVSIFTTEGWCRMLGEKGFKVQSVIPFISAAILRRWSLLTLTPLRAMGLLKIVPPKSIHRLAATIQKHLMMHSYNHLSEIESAKELGDYVLIVSKKAGQ